MIDTASIDPATMAIVGVMGLNTLTLLIQAIWGGNGERGIKERVAVLESDVKHIAQDTRDIKGALGILHRDADRERL